MQVQPTEVTPSPNKTYTRNIVTHSRPVLTAGLFQQIERHR